MVMGTGDRTIRSILFDIARQNVWPAPYCGRVLQNDFSEKWRGREADLLQHQHEESARYAAARAAGDFDTAAVIAGEVVDLITDIPTAAEIIDRMMTTATHLLAGASGIGAEARSQMISRAHSRIVQQVPAIRAAFCLRLAKTPNVLGFWQSQTQVGI
jgi:hypothetical protein